ncbi:unnamed protein product [Prunus brigantina]
MTAKFTYYQSVSVLYVYIGPIFSMMRGPLIGTHIYASMMRGTFIIILMFAVGTWISSAHARALVGTNPRDQSMRIIIVGRSSTSAAPLKAALTLLVRKILLCHTQIAATTTFWSSTSRPRIST